MLIIHWWIALFFDPFQSWTPRMRLPGINGNQKARNDDVGASDVALCETEVCIEWKSIGNSEIYNLNL